MGEQVKLWACSSSGEMHPVEAFGRYPDADERFVQECDYAAIARERDEMAKRVAELEREREAMRAQKDGAYTERDRLVCALSKVFPSYLARHPDADTTWDDDWRWIVFIDLPTGQASWHIHDSERAWFEHLTVGGPAWDGHTTDEKYRRLAALSARDAKGGQS